MSKHKYFIEDRSSVLAELENRVDTTSNLLEAAAYITWNCVLPVQKTNFRLAKENGVKSYLISHGYFGWEDHLKNIFDIHTPIRAEPVISDGYFAWGQAEVDDLPTKAMGGYEPKNIYKVGAPPIWESAYLYQAEDIYLYKCVNKDCKEKPVYQAERGKNLTCPYCGKFIPIGDLARIATQYYGGKISIDPATNKAWHLLEERHEILKPHPHKKWTLYMPSHDTYGRHLIHVRKNFKQVKDLPNLLIKASDAYLALEDKNPFKDLPGYKYCARCDELIQLQHDKEYSKDDKCPKCGDGYGFMPKVMYGRINQIDNIKRVRKLISESKAVIIDYASTPNLIAHAQDTPIIVPLADYGVRDVDKVANHITQGDIACEPDKINETALKVLHGELDNPEGRKANAEYYGAVSQGFPAHNIMKVLGEGI